MFRFPTQSAGFLAALGAAALLLQGCESMYYSEEQDIQLQRDRQQMQQVLQQDTDRSSREVATLRADLHAFQESQKQLYTVIDELRQENNARAQEIEKLRSLVASLESRVGATDSAWRNDMLSFKEKLGQEQQKAMTKLTSNLADEMARNLNQVRQANESAKAAASAQEYTVQAGDTVSAIAKAFGVSPEALCSANGIQANKIRVGQRLKIPSR